MKIDSIQGNKGTLYKINNELITNFSNLIYYGKLFNNFVIQHYIAFNTNKFGYFYKDTQGYTEYYLLDADKVEICSIPTTVDVSYKVADKSTRPNAALVYLNSKIIKIINTDYYKIIPNNT